MSNIVTVNSGQHSFTSQDRRVTSLNGKVVSRAASLQTLLAGVSVFGFLLTVDAGLSPAQAGCILVGSTFECTGDGNPATSEGGGYIGIGNNVHLSFSATAANTYVVDGGAPLVITDATHSHWLAVDLAGSNTILDITSYVTLIPSSFLYPGLPITYGAPVSYQTMTGSGTANISAEAIINNFEGPALNLRGHDVTLNLNPSASGANNGASIYSIGAETISFIPYGGVATAGIFSNNPFNIFNAATFLDASSPDTIGNYRIGDGKLTVNNGLELGGNIDLVLKVYEPETPIQPGGFGIPPVPGARRIGTTVFNNNRSVTGYFQLGSGDDAFNNAAAAVYDLRDYADTNRDLVRDTERVAVSDFGAGADLFTNTGTLSLQTVPAATVDTATNPQYIPVALTGGYLASFYDITRADVEQGDLLNLETFTNTGVITMQDAQTGGAGAVAGDVLYISANGKADGTAGKGTFITDAGSSLRLDTVLNQGSAANSLSDVLVVDGTQVRSGPTTIYVAKAGGVGASTDLNNNGLVDEGEGILVVEVLDASRSAQGAFALAGNAVLNGTFGNHTYANEGVIIDGAYAYRLAGPGTYDVAAAPSSGDWYLVNQLAPTIPVYETPPDQITPPTLQQRVGNRYWKQPEQKVFCKDASQNYQCAPTAAQAETYADKTGSATEDSAIWGRMEGVHGHNEPRVSTTNQTYDDTQWNLEAGLDGLLHKDEKGDLLIGGLTAHYGQSNKDVMSALGDGTVDNTGYGVGATLTWYEKNGFYVDAQGLASWYSRDLSSDQLGSLVKGNDGFGYALSLEAGKRIDLNNTWTLTPQAQLVYGSVDFDSFTDPFGATVDPQRADSLKGRLGLSADHENAWQDDAGKTRRTHVYGITNLYYEFLGESEVEVSGVKLVSEPERLWGEIGLGGTYSWDDGKYAVNGEVNTSTSLASFGDSTKFGGTLGLSINW